MKRTRLITSPIPCHRRALHVGVVVATWIASSIAMGTPLYADSPQATAQQVTAPVESGVESDLPPESELVYLPTKSPNPVPPKGWRRTENGWENVATWPKPGRPLGAIVSEQELREPRWFNHVLSQVRQLPPLTFAALQLAAIAVVVGLSRGRRLRGTGGNHEILETHERR